MTARRPALAAAASALALAAAPAGRARADIHGGGWLHYELTGLTAVDEGMAPGAPGALVLAGTRLHGFVSRNTRVAYHAGIDLAAGGTIGGGGFAYDVALLPAGVVLRAGESSIVGIGAGIGALGATRTLDDAATLPVEVVAELGVGPVRLLARARVAFVLGAGALQGGAPSAAFADLLDGTLGVRLGRRDHDHGFATGDGYFVGASYRELAGVRFVGLTIGFSIDAAKARRPVRDEADDYDCDPCPN